MTEPLIAIALRPAATLASKVGAKLARSMAFRWRVVLRIRGSIEFEIPTITLFKWLKSRAAAAFHLPPEEAAVSLASSLNEALSSNTPWRDADDRDSKSIQVIEALYAALLSLSDPGEARLLQEHWSRARHETLIDRLSVALGPLRLSPADLAGVLLRESQARSRVRLRPFGLSPELIETVISSLNSRNLTSRQGHVTTLVGEFGAGKSEMAESWLRSAIATFATEPDAPTPLWIKASEVQQRSLHREIMSRVSPVDLAGKGIYLVLDGLDEIGSRSGPDLAAQAHAFVETQPLSAVVLTSRPGVLAMDDSQVFVEPLSEDSALEIVALVSGEDQPSWRWNPLLLESIRRPFFAIAAGVLIADSPRPRGEPELIASLVERALSSPSSASGAVHSDEIFRALMKLAVAATNAGLHTDGLTFIERQRVRSTTLVHESRDGRLSFSLPIFEQWFAAQALLSDSNLAKSAMTASRFGNWRWAMAIACLTAPLPLQDELLELATRANPGAASWILTRVAAGHKHHRDEESPPLDVDSAGERLLRAIRTWIDAIGDLAIKVFPIAQGHPISIGVRASARQLDWGWITETVAGDRVVNFPTGTSPWSQSNWQWERSGSVPDGTEWPWMIVHDRVARMMIEVLENDPIVGPRDGVWHRESLYRAAKLITARDEPIHRRMRVGDVRRAGQQILDWTSAEKVDLQYLTYRTGNQEVRGEIIRDLLEALTEADEDYVTGPTPPPDLDPFGVDRSHPLKFYSDKALVAFHAEALGLACTAYEEAVEAVYNKFDWSLSTWASRPFGVIAEVAYYERWGDFASFGLTYARIPLTEVTRIAHEYGLTVSSNGRAAVQFASSYTGRDGWVEGVVRDGLPSRGSWESRPFRSWGSTTTITDHTRLLRPASSLAASWIWSDLGRIELTSGTFPRLDK